MIDIKEDTITIKNVVKAAADLSGQSLTEFAEQDIGIPQPYLSSLLMNGGEHNQKWQRKITERTTQIYVSFWDKFSDSVYDEEILKNYINHLWKQAGKPING